MLSNVLSQLSHPLKQTSITHTWLGTHHLIGSLQLRILIFYNFTVHDHLDYVYKRAVKTLGFIKRTTFDLRHTSSIIYLYKTLVLPLLTYCSTILSPYQHTYIDKLEGIQLRLLRYLALESGTTMSYTDHDYSKLYFYFLLPSMYQIRSQIDVTVAFKWLHRFINSPDAFDRFTTRDTRCNLCQSQPLSLTPTSCNYILFLGSQKLKRVWNKLPPAVRCLPNISAFKVESRKLKFKQLLSVRVLIALPS